jgi:hypothetical protein
MAAERTILQGTTVVDVRDGSAHRAVDVTIDGGRYYSPETLTSTIESIAKTHSAV